MTFFLIKIPIVPFVSLLIWWFFIAAFLLPFTSPLRIRFGTICFLVVQSVSQRYHDVLFDLQIMQTSFKIALEYVHQALDQIPGAF